MEEEQYEEYIQNILILKAYEKFGYMLGFLCEKSLLSQREVGRRAVLQKKYLVSVGRLHADSSTGAVDQSELSRVIHGKKAPLYAQIYIWFEVLKERFNEEEYKATCAMVEEPAFVFTQDFEEDMWHAASYASPREIAAAYVNHDNIIY